MKSCKLKLMVKSSTGAELVEMSDMCSTVLWALEWLRELDNNVKSALVYQDNLSAMQLAINGDLPTGKSKHIEIRYYLLKNYIDNWKFEIKHQTSYNMIAEILTNPIQGEQFRRHRKNVGIHFVTRTVKTKHKIFAVVLPAIDQTHTNKKLSLPNIRFKIIRVYTLKRDNFQSNLNVIQHSVGNSCISSNMLQQLDTI